MNYRSTVLLARTDVGASGTKTVDINIKDVISRLWIRFGFIVPSTPTPTDVAAANVTKIEVVDGSDVIHSMTGMCNQALDFYSSGRVRHNNGSYVPAWENVASFYINFGRHLWDKDLAFDPTKFTNPQIKITFDEDVAVASTETNYLSIVADCFDEAASPTGFLMSKEIYSYTPTANAKEYVDMPTDYAYRKIMLQARVVDKWLGAIVSNLKLSEDADKRVPLDMENELFESWLKDQFPRYREHIVADVDQTTGLAIFSTPTQGMVFSGSVYAASAVLNAVPFGYDNTIKSGDNIGYQTLDVVGDVPHGCLTIPFGKQGDAEDWYDVKGHDLQFIIEAGASATGTYRVIGEQLRSY